MGERYKKMKYGRTTQSDKVHQITEHSFIDSFIYLFNPFTHNVVKWPNIL